MKIENESNASLTNDMDECQLYINKNLAEFKTFTTKEEAEKFCEEWEGEQLSAISMGNIWYISLPNVVSKAVHNSIIKTEKLLKLAVPLGFEYIINKTWAGCH